MEPIYRPNLDICMTNNLYLPCGWFAGCCCSADLQLENNTPLTRIQNLRSLITEIFQISLVITSLAVII